MDITDLYQKLNSMAEKGWEEQKTTAFIARTLGSDWVKKGVIPSGTGLLYLAGKGKKSIFLRADIDGLVFGDKTIHACGHSAHMAGLIKAYQYAKTIEQQLVKENKSMYFLFQPAEETFPSGAKAVVDQWKELHDCLYGFGLHVEPHLPIGSIWCEKGPVMANGDYCEITVHGQKEHIRQVAVNPHIIDAIEGAALAVGEMKEYQKTIMGKGAINVGIISGGDQPNAVAGKVVLQIDIRGLTDAIQKRNKQFLTEKLPNILKRKYKGTLDVRYFDGYPALANDRTLSREVIDYLSVHSDMHVDRTQFLDLGVEDFAFYQKLCPVLFARVGTGGGELHTENFTVPKKSLQTIETYWKNVIDWWISY